MPHICITRVSIGSDNGLAPNRRQAIIWTNAGLLSIGPLVTNFSEILIKIQNFSLTKMHLKISSAKWRTFCPESNIVAWHSILGRYTFYSMLQTTLNLLGIHNIMSRPKTDLCSTSLLRPFRQINLNWKKKKKWNFSKVCTSSPKGLINNKLVLVPGNNHHLDSSPPGQNGRRFADDIFRCIFATEKFCILIETSLKFVPRGPIDKAQHRFWLWLDAE